MYVSIFSLRAFRLKGLSSGPSSPRETNRRVGDFANGVDNAIGQRRVLVIDQENPVLAGEEADIAAPALDVADGARHGMDRDLDVVEVLCISGKGQEKHGKTRQ